MAEEYNDAPVVMYTDGACLGNPGPGGYGVLLISGERQQELSAGYRLTTNNRMEILAVIAGLRALPTPADVVVYSDSKYVVDAMTKGWVRGWRAKGWRKSDGAPALNADLWEELWRLTQHHQVNFQWVKGHAGEAGNERVDRLSVAAAKGKNLPEDTGYLTGGKAPTPGANAAPKTANQQTLFGSGETNAPQAQAMPARGGAPTTPAVRADQPPPTRPPASNFDGTADNRVQEVRAGAGFLAITFRDERELRVPLAWFPALAAASPADRAEYAITDDGRTVRFPRLGVEVPVARVLGLEAKP